MSEAVLLERSKDVLRVTLHNPAKLNALRPADIRALRDTVLDLAPDVRAVVFTGAGGRSFTAGMHLDTFPALDRESARSFISDVRDMLAAVRTVPVPTLAAVDGYCIGVGFELAMACDLRVVTTRSSFGLPEIKVGIPSIADAALLAQHVGLSLAKEIILTGDMYPVERFATSGLCNALVAPELLAEGTEEMLARVTGHAPAAMAAQKRLFEVWQNTGLAAGADISVREFASVFPSTPPA
ncbi:enoyl-CoA hydratase [Pseudonocardia eucalypti]|uniref:Enoyl-CoA hydratase n=1 Tax=Pseudonocardia eucalypti TaxID=648755 RepID=A0ABP9Q5X8_9PSEU|nr:enoyl-CoA hydratase/carnithine racemase [Pseudonocardia eucalypti]